MNLKPPLPVSPACRRLLDPELCGPVLIVAAGALCWSNSLTGPFIFDDIGSIVENSTIRSPGHIRALLSPPATGITVQGRPLLNLTFALNHAFGGLTVTGYHVMNVAIHILAALTLFGVVQRTLRLPSMLTAHGSSAPALALGTALLWLCHPLQTSSVTFVSQRAESLMGLLLFAALYAFVHSVSSPRPLAWRAAAVCASALGMAVKEAMVVAPLLVLLFDRTYAAGSFRRALSDRWRIHAALFCTWVILPGVTDVFGDRGGSAGFFQGAVSPREYALTQAGIILGYLRLAVWPAPLVFDYGEPDAGVSIIRSLSEALPEVAIVGGLVAGSILLLRRAPHAGFPLAWVFVTLAPASSVLPVVTEVAAEHRMYLPLAGLAALLVVGGHSLALGTAAGRAAGSGRRFAAVVASIVLVFGTLVLQRNRDYRTAVSIWADTIEKRPENVRARINLGWTYYLEGDAEDAIRHLREAARRAPRHWLPHENLGVIFANGSLWKEAAAELETAQLLRPSPRAACSLVRVWSELGDVGKAAAAFRRCLELGGKADPVIPSTRSVPGIERTESSMETGARGSRA